MVARIYNQLNTVSEHRVHTIKIKVFHIVPKQYSKCSRAVNNIDNVNELYCYSNEFHSHLPFDRLWAKR